MTTLRFIRDVDGFYGDVYPKGSTIKYVSWNHDWQGKTEPERVAEGIFVFCYGQGEFDAYRKGIEVEVVE